MALLWCDGFDHYGSAANLTEGAWAEIGAAVSLQTSNPRTGTHSLRISSTASVASGVARRVLGGPKTTVGIAGAFYYVSLPSVNNRCKLFDFRDAANAVQVTIIVQSTGTVSAFRGSSGGTLLGTSANPAITAETYQHVEALVAFDNTVGSVEVRVNGVTVLSLAGIDTVASSLAECSQVSIGGVGSAIPSDTGTPQTDIEDVFCYDDTGSFNNTFLGDRRVLTQFPNADTPTADWSVVGAANGYQAINQATPDGDATYISAGVPGSPVPASQFGIADLPAGVSAVSAVVIVGMSRKTEAGPADTQWSVVSGSSEQAGTVRQMTEIYTYRQDVFEVDPDTAAPFTPSAVDALQIKVERVQ